MVAVFFRGGGDAQQLRRCDAIQRLQAADGEFAGGESARFVEDERIDLCRQFDVRHVLDENA